MKPVFSFTREINSGAPSLCVRHMLKTLNYPLLELKLGQIGETILPPEEGNDRILVKRQYLCRFGLMISQLNYLQICKISELERIPTF